MSRIGATFFLGDLAFLADLKFRALARRLTDADEFNSAVGAYWIALAAARRSGSPVIDVEEETGSRFVSDLIAVGLLVEDGFPDGPFTEWAPSSPQQVAGRVRAARAQRNEAGQFQPSSPSEASALDPLEKLDQPPIHSLPIQSPPTLRSVSTTPRAPARDFEADAVIEDLQHAEYESSKLADIPFSELLAKPI